MSAVRALQLKMNRLKPAINNALDDIGRSWDAQRRQETADWDTKPVFTHEVVDVQDVTELRLQTNDNRWAWIDKGTGTFGAGSGRPYTIRPKGNYPLRFQTGYSARTAPIAQSGVGTGEASGNFVSAYSVEHPGIRNRDFTKTYAERNKSLHVETIRQTIKRTLSR